MSKPTNETGLPARIVLLAIRFTAANDLGDEISDKLDGDDSPTPAEITALEMASEQADRDYNESKALLFAAVRELTGQAETVAVGDQPKDRGFSEAWVDDVIGITPADQPKGPDHG